MRSSRREVAELNAQSIDLPELPPTWVPCHLGAVASLQPGYAFKSSWFEPSGVRLLRGINIEPSRLRWADVACIAPERAREFAAYDLRPGDVVIAMDRPIISSGLKVAALSEADVPSLLLQRVGRFNVSPALERAYLFRFLNSETFLAHIGRQATGTQLPHISGTDVETVPFPLPPLAEQRRIVAKIDALTAKSRRAKEALDAIPPLLERFRQSVLAAAFRGDLTAGWREKNPDVEPAEELLKRIRVERRRRWEEAELAKMRAKGKVPGDDRWKEKYEKPAEVDASELPELPEGWAWGSLEEVTLSFDSDRIPLKLEDRDKRAGSYPYYGASGIIDTIDAYLFDGDFLLIAEDGANLLSRSTPIAFEARGQFWVNNHAHVVKPVAIPMPYLREYLNGIDLTRHVTGTAQPKLTQKNMNVIPVPIAPSIEAELIARLVHKAAERVGALIQHRDDLLEKISALDRSILAKAFRGELVPQDPTDEPASVLLERLRAERNPVAAAAPNDQARTGKPARKPRKP